LDAALGRPIEAFAEDLRRRSEIASLGELRADAALLDRTVAAAVKREELARITPALESATKCWPFTAPPPLVVGNRACSGCATS
jgi:hypothetical protein